MNALRICLVACFLVIINSCTQEKSGRAKLQRLPLHDRIQLHLTEGIALINDGRDGLTPLYMVCTDLRKREKLGSFEYFTALQSMARCHKYVKSQMDSAQLYLKKLLAFSRSYDELRPQMPQVLIDLAEVTMANRDDVSAMVYCEEGLMLASDPYLKSELLTLKGTLFRKMKLYDSASQFYTAAESILSKEKVSTQAGKLLREQALTAIIVKNDSAFKAIVNKLTGLDGKYSHNGDVNVSRLWGYFYYEKGDATQCIQFYERALREFKSEKLPDPVQVMEAYYAITSRYTLLRNYDKAEERIYEGMTYLTSFQDKPRSWSNLFSREIAGEAYNFINYGLLADVYRKRFYKDRSKQNDLNRSLQLYRAIDSLMLEQVRVVEEDAVIHFLSEGHKLYNGGIDVCYELFSTSSDPKFLGQAHLFMERSKALMMYRDVLIRQQQYFPEVPVEFKERELHMKARITALKKDQSFTSDKMSKHLREINEYYEEMAARYPDYYNAKYKIDITPFDEITAMAERKQQSIIQYHWSDEYLYYLKYDEPVRFGRIRVDSSLSISIDDLRELLEKGWAVRSKNTEQAYMTLAYNLYQKLLSPVKASKEKLLIIPDGSLTQLPFEALITKPSGHFDDASYLIDEKFINYSSSLKVYEINSASTTPRPTRILGYAFTEEVEELPPLPGTMKEVRTIQEVYEGTAVVVRTNRAITHDGMLVDLELPFNVIHIGLHASSSLRDRWENRIYCGANNSSIYGFEIAPLDIKAHTVVLTGCRSGTGADVSGEGTYSLARAFKQAGVTNVVSSLWNLSDNTTAEVVGHFYRGLSIYGSASESLVLAKRKYLASADELTAHPHFWAALVCQGK
ncbi:MAG: CHAT domain-containing protein [Bacteroidota bacterium]